MKIQKNKSIQQMLASMLMVLTLIPTGSFAANFDATCEKPLNLSEQKKAKGCNDKPTDPNCVTINKNLKGMGGDQILAYCMQADIARRTYNLELAKSIVYTAGAVACGGLAIGFWAGTDSACSAISYSAAGIGAVVDFGGKWHITSKSKDYKAQCDQISDEKWGQLNNLFMTSVAAAPMGATQALTKFTKFKVGKTGGCIVCAASLGIVAGISIDSTLSADKAMNANVINAESINADLEKSVSDVGGSFNSSQKNDHSVVQNSPEAPLQNKEEDCSAPGVKGDAYMNCISKQVPEIAAITSNPDVKRAFSKALKGKNLGDFIKGYNGKEDVKDYVAKGMGMSPELFKSLNNASNQFAKNIGLSIQPQSGSSSSFAKVGGASAGGRGDLDYGSKAAAGVASNLNDASLGGEKETAALDPADALFRQLDLLSPDQIESNPKISLFVRAAYRYRKNINNVEKLNSALEERVPATNKR